MTTNEIGVQPYLGIHIDYDKEKLLNIFSKETLKDRYFWKGETHAQQAIARASIFGATYKEHINFNLGQKLYEYASNNWFSFSTPLTAEPAVVYLSVAFLIMSLIQGMVYLLIMMKTYGLQAEVEGLVDFGEMFVVMVWVLLVVAALLDLSRSCT